MKKVVFLPLKLTSILFYSILFYSILFYSCTNYINTEGGPKLENFQNQQTEQLVSISIKTTGLPSDVTSAISRSAIASELSKLFYEVTATAVEDSSIIVKNTYQLNEQIEFFVTPSYTYNVTINANYKNPSGIIYTIFTGEYNNLNPLAKNSFFSITLTQKTDYNPTEYGSLSLPINFQGNGFDDYYISVKFSGSPTIDDISKTALTNPYTITKNDIAPGTYGMIIYFYKSEDASGPQFIFPTSFTIYAGMQTNTWQNEPMFLNEDGNFTVKENTQLTFENLVFYVCGTGETVFPSDVTPSDENSGSAYSPLASLSAAVAKCTDTNKTYTIFVDGVVNRQANTEIEENSKITILGLSDNASIVKTENPNDYRPTIWIWQNSVVTIENIIFDGNEVSEDCNFIRNEGNLTLNKCVIKNWKFTSGDISGGTVVYSKDNGCITAENCVFDNNYGVTKRGGAFYIDGGNNSFTNCSFINNTAFGRKINNNGTESVMGGFGGVIYVKSGTVRIEGERTLFNNNTATFAGGAIYVEGGEVTICDATITNNKLSMAEETSGGAIYTKNALTAERCLFSGNEAKLGGAIYKEGSSNVTLTECLIGTGTKNEVSYTTPNKANSGAAVYCVQGDIIFTNCVIGNNSLSLTDFANSTEQVTFNQNQAQTNAGNIGTNSVIETIGTVKLDGDTRVCYNYADESIINISNSKNTGNVYIGTGGGTDVQVYGNTLSNTSSSNFVSIINNTDRLFIYGKVHHNYVNNSGGVILNSGSNSNIYLQSSAEICYNNQEKRDKSVDKRYGSIVNDGGKIYMYCRKIIGNHSTTTNNQIYEVFNKGTFEINITVPIQIGVAGVTNKYNGIYLAEKESALFTVILSSAVNLANTDQLIQLDIPDEQYQNNTKVLSNFTDDPERYNYLPENYSKFKMANSQYFIKVDGTITNE